MARPRVAPGVDTPSALVDADQLERNLVEMARLCQRHGKRLRPHVKTHKTAQIAARQCELGAVGLTVAKIGEAEALADAGLDDLLVCYPMVGPLKLARLAALARRATVSTVVDSLAAAEALATAMTKAGVRLDVLLKLDAAMHRVGVPHSQAERLAMAVAGLAGLRLRGVCIHEGGVYTEPDPARRRVLARRAGAGAGRDRPGAARPGTADRRGELRLHPVRQGRHRYRRG